MAKARNGRFRIDPGYHCGFPNARSGRSQGHRCYGTDDVVLGAVVVVVVVVVVVDAGDAAACAGTITDSTTGRVHDLGRIPSAIPAPAPVPIAFNSGRRFISSVIFGAPSAKCPTGSPSIGWLGGPVKCLPAGIIVLEGQSSKSSTFKCWRPLQGISGFYSKRSVKLNPAMATLFGAALLMHHQP